MKTINTNQSKELSYINFASASTQVWVNAETGEAFLESESFPKLPQYLGIVSDLENYADREPALVEVPAEDGGLARVWCYIWKNIELGVPLTAEDFDAAGDFLRFTGIL